MHWLNLFLNMRRPLQFQGKGMSFKVGSLTSEASAKCVKTDLSLLFYREVLNCISYCEVGVDILLHGYGYFCSLHKQFCHGFFWRVAQAQKGKTKETQEPNIMCCLRHFWLMLDNALIQEEAQEYTHEDSIGLLLFGTVFFSQTDTKSDIFLRWKSSVC